MQQLRAKIPRHLSYRVWLLTLPSALISFERRQSVPKLPIAGRWRLSGVPVLAAGLALILLGTRGEGARLDYSGPGSQLTRNPGTAGGIVMLLGLAVLLRSSVLTAYSAALILASGSNAMTLEEPDIDNFTPGER